jgi:hypothetical protein
MWQGRFGKGAETKKARMSGLFCMIWFPSDGAYRGSFLNPCDVCRLKAFRALHYLEANLITLCERFEAVSGNGGEMHKNVLAALLLKKTETLAVVKPFYFALYHFSFSCFRVFMPGNQSRIMKPPSVLLPDPSPIN